MDANCLLCRAAQWRPFSQRPLPMRRLSPLIHTQEPGLHAHSGYLVRRRGACQTMASSFGVSRAMGALFACPAMTSRLRKEPHGRRSTSAHGALGTSSRCSAAGHGATGLSPRTPSAGRVGVPRTLSCSSRGSSRPSGYTSLASMVISAFISLEIGQVAFAFSASRRNCSSVAPGMVAFTFR